MKTVYVFVCVTFLVALVTESEAKGGRSGGGSGGRSGGRTGGRSGVRSRGTKNSGSISSYSGSSRPHNSNTGGFFGGLIRTAPYHYAPSFIGRGHYSHYSDSSHHSSYNENKQQQALYSDVSTASPNDEIDNKGESAYAVGYAISKALGNDFLSIFNMVHDISKYPSNLESKQANPEISTTSTTSAPTTTTTTTEKTPITIETTEDPVFQQLSNSFSSNGRPRNDYSNALASVDEILSSINFSSIDSDSLPFMSKLAPLDTEVHKSDNFDTPNHNANALSDIDIDFLSLKVLEKKIDELSQILI